MKYRERVCKHGNIECGKKWHENGSGIIAWNRAGCAADSMTKPRSSISGN